ncbi:MAG: phosphatidate cytidylyltransferase [Candidatus Aminicenantes bacterium]|nr:phosphatidate cytidylyltransferase [Candidatus Aminicenantes bacterium]
MKEFITRTITAFFLIIAAYFWIRFVPGHYFSIILFLLISAGAYELLKLSKPGSHSKIIIFVNGLIIALSFTFGKPDLPLAIMIVIVLTGLFFLFSTTGKEKLDTFVRDIGIHFLIVFYLYIPLYFVFELKKMGPNYLFFLIFVIAVGDSAAYFIGSAIGKHKIYQVASPRKSLEGLIAAIVFAAFSGWLALLIFPVTAPVKIWIAILTGGIIGLFSQLSDPVESLFKRAAGQKDSSSILPGHGGILDRLDSYIFCAPVLFYLVRYLWA